MTGIYLSVNNIRPGNIAIEDIYVNTKFPIINKNTELTTEHIDILQAFGIKEVKVGESNKNKNKKNGVDTPSDVNELIEDINQGNEEIKEQYDFAVISYKRKFNGWRAGTRPNIAKIREIILPLFQLDKKQKIMLALLNDFAHSNDYLYHHSISVGILASAISEEMGYSVGQTMQIGIAGVLADCGMAKIDPSITEKAAFLTIPEFNEVKKHTIYSYQMLKESPFILQEMKLAIFQHHERLDGSGYPRGDKLNNISILSQILAVADVFHAMSSERIHRAKESPFKVLEMIMEEEFGKFDINVVLALHNLVGNLTIGTKVRLTNGEDGEVIFVHRDARLRPMVKMNSDDSILNLTKNRHLAVERILS